MSKSEEEAAKLMEKIYRPTRHRKDVMICGPMFMKAFEEAFGKEFKYDKDSEGPFEVDFTTGEIRSLHDTPRET